MSYFFLFFVYLFVRIGIMKGGAMKDVQQGQVIARHIEAGLDARDLQYLVAAPFSRPEQEPETVLFNGLRISIE
jgi:hypothetical protein